MPKRVHELAKELNVKSKVLIDKLNNLLGIETKNHMTLLEDDQVEKVLVLFGIRIEKEVKDDIVDIQETNEEVTEIIEVEADNEVVKVKDKDIEPKQPKSKQINNNIEVSKPSNHKKEDIIKVNNVIDDIKPNVVMDDVDEILIEKYLEDDTKVSKFEKIVQKDKSTFGEKRSNTSVNDKRNNKNNFKKRRDRNFVQVKQEPVLPKKISIHDTVIVKDLAEKLRKPASEIIKKLFLLGIVTTINQEIDYDTAVLVSMEFGVDVELEDEVNAEERLINDFEDKQEDLVERPPVVVVMGHVDHGKTSLLDAIRETNVIEKEAGGITQHIGAYSVNVNGKKITFLDTPGHAAFTAMRARGAQVTDIAILVVAADDSIMPQTIEAINHAKAAGIATIIAINKIDKPSANVEKVKQDLSQHGLLVEDWGGDIVAVPISAKEKLNIDQLLEMVLLSADMLELKANPKRLAKGAVIESKLDKGRGSVATVLVQNGTLNVGDTVVIGNEYGKVRAMLDDKGNKVKKAGPSTPVEILGLSGVPNAGDEFYAVEDEKTAKVVAEKRRIKSKEETMKCVTKVSLEQLFEQIQQCELKELNIIVKADVQGSAQAVKQSLEKLSDEDVRIKVIHSGVGAINESDIMLASASNAIIIGFNIRPEPSAVSVAKGENVDIRLYSVIYKAIEDIQAAMKGMLDPEFKEVILGHAEVRNIFKHSMVGTIAGCRVLDGKFVRNGKARVLRDNIVIFEGSISSLKREKDDVKEVQSGFECGLTLDKHNDIIEGDIIECFEIKQVER